MAVCRRFPLATDQKVRSSNLFGRAIFPTKSHRLSYTYRPLEQATKADTVEMKLKPLVKGMLSFGVPALRSMRSPTFEMTGAEYCYSVFLRHFSHIAPLTDGLSVRRLCSARRTMRAYEPRRRRKARQARDHVPATTCLGSSVSGDQETGPRRPRLAKLNGDYSCEAGPAFTLPG